MSNGWRDDERLAQAAEALWQLAPGEPEEILLFGSRARPDPPSNSDADFMVIVHGPVARTETDAFSRAVLQLGQEMGLELDVMLRTWDQLHEELARRVPRIARRAIEGALLVLPPDTLSRFIPMASKAIHFARLRWVAGDFGLIVAGGNLVPALSCLGQYNPAAKSIVYDDGIDDGAAAMAVIHELSHFVLHPFEESSVVPPCTIEGDDHRVVDNAAEAVCERLSLPYRQYLASRGRHFPLRDQLDQLEQTCVQAISSMLLEAYEAVRQFDLRGGRA